MAIPQYPIEKYRMPGAEFSRNPARKLQAEAHGKKTKYLNKSMTNLS